MKVKKNLHILDFVEDALVRKNQNKFCFSLTYSYLCTQKKGEAK